METILTHAHMPASVKCSKQRKARTRREHDGGLAAKQVGGYADYCVRYGLVDFATAYAASGAWRRGIATLDESCAAVQAGRALAVPA